MPQSPLSFVSHQGSQPLLKVFVGGGCGFRISNFAPNYFFWGAFCPLQSTQLCKFLMGLRFLGFKVLGFKSLRFQGLRVKSDKARGNNADVA